MTDLTHLDDRGQASMVDVSDKDETQREAVAIAAIALKPETLAMIAEGTAAKGDVIATARIAGIMAAKKTADLVPLCHPLMLTSIKVEIEPAEDGTGLVIGATVKTRGQTGVEMEAMTAVSVAALTIYDMVKAVDRSAVIGGIRLVSKSGGKSGDFVPEAPAAPAAKGPTEQPLVSRGFRRAPGSGPARPRTVDLGPATPKATHSRAEAFRTFMKENRMQVTAWASSAGLPIGLVYGFLHGRVGRLPKDAEEKLAKAASASVRDVFGSD